ncbi:hypothetical protein LC085_03920 [Bacillus tianshenii]|uniref:hypothetical protein n=1 Tax=Sutcliffiella tianshenii TaxID=1463404 RepID=UPI001CD7F17E|nr:hypothetical protein [Bacillus tianshenii]MCA1319049.1 hypothetical protein [Bacillus tianshenii]
MGSFDLMLGVIALLIVVGGFIYTYRVGRRSNSSQGGEMDSVISEKVQDHYVLRNPIFLAYLVAAVLILIFIGYAALSL